MTIRILISEEENIWQKILFEALMYDKEQYEKRKAYEN